MTAFAVWTFVEAGGAGQAERSLAAAAARAHVKIHDGAVITWPSGRRRPRRRELEGVARTAVLADAYWGLLIGMVFFAPELLETTVSAPEPLTGLLAGVGVDERVIARLRGEVVPGTSALLVIAQDDVVSRLEAVLASAELLSCHHRSPVSPRQSAALRRVFAS